MQARRAALGVRWIGWAGWGGRGWGCTGAFGRCHALGLAWGRRWRGRGFDHGRHGPQLVPWREVAVAVHCHGRSGERQHGG
ncbi:MAG: hypothetical protein C4344_07205, partial [Acidimicrobiia bacterium]